MQLSLFSAIALLSSSALAATGKLGDAPITTNNVAGVSYQATLPDRNTTGLRGQITAVSGGNGTGVTFNINFYGFPAASQGPFSASFTTFRFIRKSLLTAPSLPHS